MRRQRRPHLVHGKKPPAASQTASSRLISLWDRVGRRRRLSKSVGNSFGNTQNICGSWYSYRRHICRTCERPLNQYRRGDCRNSGRRHPGPSFSIGCVMDPPYQGKVTNPKCGFRGRGIESMNETKDKEITRPFGSAYRGLSR